MSSTDWNFATIFEGVARRLPDSPAVIDGERVFSWAAFDQRADALAQDLTELRLPRQTKIAVYLRNCAEFLESYYAALKIGLVPVNLNYRYGPDELVHVLADSDTEVVIVHAEFADVVRQMMPRLPRVRRWYVVGADPGETSLADRPEVVSYQARVDDAAVRRPPDWAERRSGDDLMLIYTGGTTGMPKGVMWRQDDLFEGLVGSSRAAFNLSPVTTTDALLASVTEPGPRGLSASPFMHGTGLLHQFVMLMSGGTAVVLPGHRFDAHHLWDTVARNRVTAVVIVGDAFARPMLEALSEPDASYELSALEVISSSGAIWSRAVKQGLLARLPWVRIFDSLASSEGFGLATSVATADQPDETTRFTLGRHVRVLADDGTWLDAGDPRAGRLVVTGALPLGYYKDPAKTEATFPQLDGERYSIPGDYVRVLADSTVVFLGRGSTCINTGGEKVYPEEVEQVVKTHPAVSDVAIVGVPDERFGSVVCALVQLAPGATVEQSELTEWVRERLASYKAPRRLVTVDAVPRTAQGKVDYRGIEERALTQL